MQPRTGHHWVRDPKPGLVVAVTGIALAGFLLLTGAVLFFPAFHEVDARLSYAIRDELRVEALDPFARGVTHIGSGVAMTVLTVIGSAVLLIAGRRAEALLLSATMIVGAALMSLLKLLVERPRPPIELARVTMPETYAFPSGHTLAAFLFFGVVGFLVFIMARSPRAKLWGWLACALLAIGVAFSRVYLGVHYVGDVIASWMLGSALITLAVAAYVGWVTRKPVE
ncbi:MAG TPA: phosphatase PAP2 family protein [Coriobacteriia bacterium]|nr:phosphatase PAP2 family protein [Coriobacteriia bacterium]